MDASSRVIIVNEGALTAAGARRQFLQMLCAIDEGATQADASPPFAAVLFDTRLACMHGRHGLPRSLGSKYACMVTFFQGGALDAKTEITCAKDVDWWNGRTELSADGKTLLCADDRGLRAVDLTTSTTTAQVSLVPSHIALAPNGAIYIAAGRYVMEVTPQLAYKSDVMCLPEQTQAYALRASARDVAVATETRVYWMRHSRALRCILPLPSVHSRNMCLLNDGKHLVVHGLNEFSVFAADGKCVRRIPTKEYWHNFIACTRANEIVVTCAWYVYAYDVGGDLLAKYSVVQLSRSLGYDVSGVLIRGCRVVTIPFFTVHPEPSMPPGTSRSALLARD